SSVPLPVQWNRPVSSAVSFRHLLLSDRNDRRSDLMSATRYFRRRSSFPDDCHRTESGEADDRVPHGS
ncbi:unnamed protein product, partial [Mycena citricolor]